MKRQTKRYYYCRHCNKRFESLAMADICFELDMTLLKNDKPVNVTAYPIRANKVREYFIQNYSHIDFEMTETQLQKWLDSRPYLKNKSIISVADSLSDYLLANGADCQP